ncbi:hypothetical protein DMP03_12495 (plasmid) [Halosegnis rubeus]|uniref:Uncharacterized protein n=1 Tax=Halosegnis rubeus TaxID=2212850 RepID=A0A5N5U429_9EURY|nr:hypothetical protein DMP03_12495 [Halosegnis rubeus]
MAECRGRLDRCVRYGPHRSPRSALRVARDRPFRACGRSPHRPRPFRAKMDVPSAPAGIPVGCAPCGLSRSSAWCRLRCRAPHRGARSRRQSPWTRTRTSGRTRAGISRWPLAPGGSARGAGWSSASGALSLAPTGRSRRRERERADESVGRCRRGNPRC